MFILQMVPTTRPLPLVNSPSPLLASVMTVPSPCNATVTETWAVLLAVPEEALIQIEQAWDQQSRSRGLLLQAMSGVMEME